MTRFTLLVFFFSLLQSVSGHGREGALSWGHVVTPEGAQPMFYRSVERPDGTREYLAHDDILVDLVSTHKAVSRSCKNYRWHGAVVPFEIDPTLPNQQRIWEAAAYFEKYTSIRLLPRTNEKDFVYFKNNGDADCSSFVGRKGGKQSINLPAWCGTGSLIHEVMHALGFYHEQSRPDRRKWINVNWMNIQLKRWGNFMTVPFGKKYGSFDFQSIMLYPSYNSFARNADKPTMQTRDGGETWGAQRAGLSATDLLGLETLYKDELSAR